MQVVFVTIIKCSCIDCCNYLPAERLAKRKRNITKADISEPSSFRHIAHVGFDPMTGFDVNGEDQELNEFFKKVVLSLQNVYQ